MDAVTYAFALNNLAAILDKTVQDGQPVVITRHNGEPVVVLSLEYFQTLGTYRLDDGPLAAKQLTAIRKAAGRSGQGKLKSRLF